MKTTRFFLCLAAFAVRTYGADEGLPPLPIDRSQPGIASITDDSSAEPVTKKWSLTYQGRSRNVILACTATYIFNGKAGTTRDYFIPISMAQLDVAATKLSKASEWTKLTRDRRPPPFRKSLGPVDGAEWIYVWSGERAIVLAQKVTLAEDDWNEFSRLIPSAREIMNEQANVQKSAQDFVDSLK